MASARPVVAIVQARTGSSRLPGKVLEPLLGRPMLERQLERIVRASSIDRVVVATTTSPKDDAVAELAEAAGHMAVRGSEEDVLDRFRAAAEASAAATVVRLTGDCPLIDPALIDEAVSALDATPAPDFVSNALSETYPDGMDAEVFPRDVLERAAREARRPSEREHVTFYIWKSGLFEVRSLTSSRNLGHLRLTVDYPEDLELVREIFTRLYPSNPGFSLDDMLPLLTGRPLPNEHHARNAGWAAALARDDEESAGA